MYSNREQQNDYMVDFRERSALTHGENLARNEFSDEQVSNGLGDFDSLLYYAPEETQEQESSKPSRVAEPRAREYAETVDSMPTPFTMSHRTHAQIKGVLPIETPASVYEYEYESIRAKEDDKQYKINSKGKVLIAVYAIVVLTIFALIVLNTRLLRNMNSDVSMLETQVQELRIEKQEVQDELVFESSDAEIQRKALEMGMTK